MFDHMEAIKFVDCDEGYEVALGNASAIIGVGENEMCCSFILSAQRGSGSKMISALEEYAKSRGKTLVFSSLISPLLEEMLTRRGYRPETRPFSIKANILDPVDVWVKKEE